MDALNIPFAVLCAISSAIVRWYGAYNSLKKKTEDKTEKRAKLEAQVEYIYTNVREIKNAINESISDRRKLSEDVKEIKLEIVHIKDNAKVEKENIKSEMEAIRDRVENLEKRS